MNEFLSTFLVIIVLGQIASWLIYGSTDRLNDDILKKTKRKKKKFSFHYILLEKLSSKRE